MRMTVLAVFCLSCMVGCGAGEGNGGTPEYLDFAYVTNQYSGSIYGFGISETGELTKVPGLPFIEGSAITHIVITPNGAFMYAAGPGSTIKINAKTGELTWKADPVVLSSSVSLYIDPPGRFMFIDTVVAGEYVSIPSVNVVRIDGATGGLEDTQGGLLYTNGTFAFDPEGKFAYMTSEFAGLRAFAVDASTGALSEIPGSPFPMGYDYGSTAIRPQGDFLYAADSLGISALALDASSGAPTEIAGSPFASGDFGLILAIDHSGRYLYAASVMTPAIFVHAIDPLTGALTPVAGSPYPLPASPRSLAVSPSGKSLYVTIPGLNAVRAYTIDANSGLLTPIAGPPIQAGTAPYHIVTVRIPQGA